MRRPSPARGGGPDWAFHATNAAIFEALARGEHRDSLREYFGGRVLEELSGLAAAVRKRRRAAGAPRQRVLIVPGMMGSRLCDLGAPAGAARRAAPQALWVDPLRIAAGHLEHLSLPGKRPIRAAGALLPAYARLKLTLSLHGFDARFFAYDWRLGIDEIGTALAAAIRAGGKSVALIAHSMGGLVARVAIKRLRRPLVNRLVMLGTPNRGAFAPVLALRGTYPFVRRLSRLDLEHSPEDLAARVFSTFPGLYQLLPPGATAEGIDLLDPDCWPDCGPRPDPMLLARVAQARARMAEADSRMVQIVGIDRETVISVRRTAAGFEYSADRNGDGTVPVSMARLPGLSSYFADEAHGELANNPRIIDATLALLEGREDCGLPRRFVPRKDPPARFDDAQLRLATIDKIDWRRLDSEQREAVLADLDGAPAAGSVNSAQSLA